MLYDRLDELKRLKNELAESVDPILPTQEPGKRYDPLPQADDYDENPDYYNFDEKAKAINAEVIAAASRASQEIVPAKIPDIEEY